jgi:hypothetical protein
MKQKPEKKEKSHVKLVYCDSQEAPPLNPRTPRPPAVHDMHGWGRSMGAMGLCEASWRFQRGGVGGGGWDGGTPAAVSWAGGKPLRLPPTHGHTLTLHMMGTLRSELVVIPQVLLIAVGGTAAGCVYLGHYGLADVLRQRGGRGGGVVISECPVRSGVESAPSPSHTNLHEPHMHARRAHLNRSPPLLTCTSLYFSSYSSFSASEFSSSHSSPSFTAFSIFSLSSSSSLSFSLSAGRACMRASGHLQGCVWARVHEGEWALAGVRVGARA